MPIIPITQQLRCVPFKDQQSMWSFTSFHSFILEDTSLQKVETDPVELSERIKSSRGLLIVRIEHLIISGEMNLMVSEAVYNNQGRLLTRHGIPPTNYLFRILQVKIGS